MTTAYSPDLGFKDMDNITFISAGAGSGKTYRLAVELEKLLTQQPPINAAGVIGTTFTKLAAGELRERVRQRLNERGFTHIANQMDQAMLGTVNSVCGQLLSRFAFEAGLSPQLKVIEEIEAKHLFNLALEQVLNVELVQDMNALGRRVGQEDWKELIKNIINTARANNQTIEQIKVSGIRSAEQLLAFYPPVSELDLDQELLKTVTAAINALTHNINVGVDTTKGTKDYLELLQQYLPVLRKQDLPWSHWVKLAKEKATKKSQGISELVQGIAGYYENHRRLHADIHQFSTQIFNLAAVALAQFQDYKKIRGLIDFTDQESLLYDLLENSQVQAVLQDELEFLMVDEFQDTSPIQLGLFLRLAKLAKKVIWVGDVKQAIYGFRGSDPELMQAILQHLEANGGKTEILPISWRSRPELVSYVNAVFVPAFENSLAKERILLNPRPGMAEHSHPAVMHWQLVGKNLAERHLALAHGIKSLIDSNYELVDKASAVMRAAHYGDIALLCRTNEHLESVANALNTLHIPMSRSQTGLLNTPEIALVLAAMRYLADPKDTLATAEILCLTLGQSPETWLQDRLAYVTQPDKSGYWGDDNPLLQKLVPQRLRLQYLTPAEVMQQAIHSADIRQIVLQWQANIHAAKQRLLNIEQLLAFANDYENQCSNENQIASVTGLLLWLNALAQDGEDAQAVNRQSEAVQLLTHHGAKGLEWPIVITLDLEANIRRNYWGLTVDARQDDLDITQPLDGRQLRYWLWPFGKQEKDIAVKDRVQQSVYGLAEAKRAEEEAKRLLYVSLTRPRDCLIIPLKDTQGEWLKSVNADWMLPQEEDSTLSLPNDTGSIPVAYKSLATPTSVESGINDSIAPRWFIPIKPSHKKLPAKISPSLLNSIDQACVVEVVTLGERICLQGMPDITHLGEAIHALIATQIINSTGDKKQLAEQVLTNYGVTENITLADALICINRLQEFINHRFKVIATHVEYPLEYQLPTGQSASGWIDLLLETEAGFIIIDHKSNPQARNEWEAVALKYSGQLELYKAAVETITKQPVLECWIHFAVTGGMLSVQA